MFRGGMGAEQFGRCISEGSEASKLLVGKVKFEVSKFEFRYKIHGRTLGIRVPVSGEIKKLPRAPIVIVPWGRYRKLGSLM